MSKTYTVITRNEKNGMIYPCIVYGAKLSSEAEDAIWRLGPDFKAIATVEGKHRVYAREYGIGYEISINRIGESA